MPQHPIGRLYPTIFLHGCSLDISCILLDDIVYLLDRLSHGSSLILVLSLPGESTGKDILKGLLRLPDVLNPVAILIGVGKEGLTIAVVEQGLVYLLNQGAGGHRVHLSPALALVLGHSVDHLLGQDVLPICLLKLFTADLFHV